MLLPALLHAELPEMKPLLGQRGQVLFRADYGAPDAKPPARGLGKFVIVNGALRLEEKPSDHHQAAVPLFDAGAKSGIQPLTNFIMQADFKNDGARNFQFGFNRMGGLAKKAADGKHWEVAPHCLTIAFNQPADPAKKHNWLVDDNSVEPFVNLGTHPVVIDSGVWHRILIEIKGDEVCVQLSNGQTIRGKAKNPADPKNGPIVRCQSDEGKGVEFRDVTVWAVE